MSKSKKIKVVDGIIKIAVFLALSVGLTICHNVITSPGSDAYGTIWENVLVNLITIAFGIIAGIFIPVDARTYKAPKIIMIVLLLFSFLDILMFYIPPLSDVVYMIDVPGSPAVIMGCSGFALGVLICMTIKKYACIIVMRKG